ncbi:MAG: hypothetical protein LBU26_00445 [Synergistaceae bacterium]|jgi:hypothetical protein|nr:hypothetical protein [Synergistaceae bacterium]
MRKKSFVLWLLFALFGFVVMAGGCGGSSSGSGDGSEGNFAKPVVYTPGEDVKLITKTIGINGGIIETGNTGTPVDGVSVTFPAGALTSETNVTLGYNLGSMTLNNGTWSGAAITLETDGKNGFDVPVEITVPTTDLYGIIAPYHVVEENGKIRPCQLKNIDTATQTATFITLHASKFLTVTPAYDFSNNTVYSSPDYGFSPSEDGFGIENFPSQNFPNGNCFGMSAMTVWYFVNEKEAWGSFNRRFTDDAERRIADSTNQLINSKKIVTL